MFGTCDVLDMGGYAYMGIICGNGGICGTIFGCIIFGCIIFGCIMCGCIKFGCIIWGIML
jgi:hypothetical protein